MVSAVPMIVSVPYTMILMPGDISRSFKLNLGNSSGRFLLSGCEAVRLDAGLVLHTLIGV